MQKKSAQHNQNALDAVQNLTANKNTKTPRPIKNRAKYICPQKLSRLIFYSNLQPKSDEFDLILKKLQIIKSNEYPLSSDNDKNLAVWSNTLKELPRNLERWLNTQLNHSKDYFEKDGLKAEIERENFEKIIQYPFPVAFLIFLLSDQHRTKQFLLALTNFAKKFEQSNQNKFFIIQGIETEFGISPATYDLIKMFDSLLTDEERDILINDFASRSYLSGLVWGNIDTEGNLSLEISPMFQMIDGINITRLRVCEVCEQIFWANRKDAFACSKQHAKTRQMRLLRANWKAKGELYLNARKKKVNKQKEK